MLQKKIKKYLNYFEHTEKKSSDEIKAWRSLEKTFITEIGMSLKCLYYVNIKNKKIHDECQVFVDNIEIPLISFINGNCESDNYLFIHIGIANDKISKKTKKIICDYLNVIFKNNYDIFSCKDYIKLKYYFLKLFIPIFFRWKHIDSEHNVKQKKEFFSLIEKNNILPAQIFCFEDFFVKFSTRVIENKDPIIYDLIKFCKKNEN